MRQELDYNIAESADDFKGWEIIAIEDWKPGVKRVYVRKLYGNGGGSFMMVFSKEEYTKDLQVNDA